MTKQLRVLIVEDSEEDAQLMLRELKRAGYEVVWERVDTPLAMSLALEGRQWDVVLSDYVMPQFSGLAALSLYRQREMDIPFILVSGTVNEDTLIEGMKLGAHDFITKGRMKRLVPAIEREIRETEVRREKRIAQNRIFKLNRLLKTISEVNQLIVRETDREKVLSEACRILVEHGKFHSVWIGLADFATGEVHALAIAGFDGGSLGRGVRCDDTPKGRGPASTAIRTGKPSICNDYETDERFSDWREEARTRGYKSAAALPILVKGTVFGVLGVYDTETQTFDREIVNLLAELTADIGYALQNLTETEERKRAVEALRESEERFRSAFDNAPVGMALISPEGRYLRVNRSLCDTLGYTAEELIGMAVEKITHPDDHYTYRAYVDQLLSGKIAYADLETRLFHKKGHILWVLVSISAVRDASGKPLHLVSQMRDISRQKQAEDTLKESEERFRSAFDDAPIGMALSSSDGHYLRVNRSLCGMLGYSEKELLATTWQAITHPDDLGMNLSYLKQTLAGKIHYFEVEKRYVHKTGRIVWAISSVSLVRDERGKPLHFVSQVRDITEQKRAAEEMVRLKQAVDNSGEIIFMTDASGTITFVNPEFTRLYGYTPEEVVGKTTPRLLESGKQTQEVYKLFWEAILAKQVVRREFINKTKGGRLVTVEVSVSPILDDRGNIAGFLAVQRDITERKRAETEREKLEAQLVQVQKMEAIGTLAGGVAHDFNNILTAIQGYTDLTLMTAQCDDPTRHNLEQVRMACERATNLTRQLLLFGQRQAVVQKPVNLNKIVTDLLKMLDRIVGERYKIETNLQADLWRVSADRGQTEQVIMNLVVNARDATPNGGVITIATENVGADEEYYRLHPHARPGELVCLSVSDKGAGMDKETLSRIFEPFFSTKERGKGTGLGLAVVHGIVQKHDGWIDVESEPGKGSTFRVFLPVASKEVAEVSKTKPEPKQSSGRGERILLVEDESTVRDLAEMVLAENGYKVFATDTVKGALDVFERERGNFDLVFNDIGLPDGSGLELAERILAKKPGIRALLTSGYSSDAGGIAAAQAKGYPFLQKPYSLGDVLRMVRAILDKK